MKTISPALATHLAGSNTTLCTLWKVIRTDGVVLGFTDLDQPLTYTDNDVDTYSSPVINTVVYEPDSGATASATDNNSDMTVSNQELVGFLDSPRITEKDIVAGKYDWCVVEIRMVNYMDLTMGDLLIKKATIGNLKIKNHQFTAELRGLEFYLGTNIGETYGPTCRADLGDSRCTKDMTLYIQTGVVVSETDLRTFAPAAYPLGSPAGPLVMRGSTTPTDPAPDGWFTGGVVTWLTGANEGYLMEVGTWDGTSVELFENLPYPIVAGDTFTIEPGCNKSDSDCQNKFNNIANMRGENRIPGMDQILIYPNANGSIPS